LAYLLDLNDKSFRTPEEIRRRLGLSLVGHIPYTSRSAAVLDPKWADLDPGLVVLHRPTSPEAEAFRGVRAALYFNTHGERHKIIQVTSPKMGDGKTTLIMNLAILIAQSGRSVILIDADLRRPRIHRAFAVPGKVGLAEILANEMEPADAI